MQYPLNMTKNKNSALNDYASLVSGITSEEISKNLNMFIEHTILKPETTIQNVTNTCNEALSNNFFGVCVPSYFVKTAKSLLCNSKVKVVTTIGFPLANSNFQAIAFEGAQACEDGADEIDMVIPVGLLKSREYDSVRNSVKLVAESIKNKHDSIQSANFAKSQALNQPEPPLLKVIIETGLLTCDEKIWACALSVEGGADFVKTCTGFAPGVAEETDIQLMRSVVGNFIGIKASAGIRDTKKAISLIQAGANRLGTSSGVALVKNSKVVGGY